MPFHLVQRCSERTTPEPARGFDGYFGLDYMGSAEFEFGTVPDSLKRFRSHDDIVRKFRRITIDGVTRQVWFVGSIATLKAKVDQFEEWVAKGCRGKEATYFPENFTGRDWRGQPIDDFYSRTVLWWALNEDVMFTLDVEIADRAIEALAARAHR